MYFNWSEHLKELDMDARHGIGAIRKSLKIDVDYKQSCLTSLPKVSLGVQLLPEAGNIREGFSKLQQVIALGFQKSKIGADTPDPEGSDYKVGLLALLLCVAGTDDFNTALAVIGGSLPIGTDIMNSTGKQLGIVVVNELAKTWPAVHTLISFIPKENVTTKQNK